MPRFDQWGLLVEGHDGPRDNPFLVVPVPEESIGAVSQATAGEGDDNSSPQVARQDTPMLVGVGDVALSGDGATIADAMSTVPSLKALIPGLHALVRRARAESGTGALPKALKKRKWVTMDE